MKRFLSVLTLLLVAGVTLAQTDTVVPQTYTYIERNGQPLLVDVYLPDNPRPDSACVFYLFGGGFVSGARNDAYSRQCCQLLAQRGFAVVSVDYRLWLRMMQDDPSLANGTKMLSADKNPFRTTIDVAAADCAAAIDYIFRKAAELGISTRRFILTGCSAGAIAVLHLDYCRANGLEPARELPPQFVPAAVIPYSGGVYTVNGRPRYATPPAPTCFFHGTKDRIVNYRKFPPLVRGGLYGTQRVQREFRRQGYSYWAMRFKGVGHEVAAVLPKTIQEFTAFVDATLEGRLMQYDATCHDSFITPTEITDMSVFDLYKK